MDVAQLVSLPWRERRIAVESILERLDSNDGIVDPLLDSLTTDPAWQVRKELADRLVCLDDGHLARHAAILAADGNHFVAEAARRSLERRRKGVREELRRRRGLDHIQTQYLGIRRIHGPSAADRARRMAERLYDVIVGETVHEMRGLVTPLVDFLGTLDDQLQDDRLDRAWLVRHVPRARARLDTVLRVVEDMREYVRATPPNRRPEPLAELCAEAVALARDWFSAEGTDLSQVQIESAVPADLFAEVSRHQVLIALRNLVKNAVESLALDARTLRPGNIHISAEKDGETAIIRVSDTGMGLTAEELAEVRRFVPGRTSKKDRGTGFGLAIAWRKIDDHGGSLNITSEPERGTTATVQLPLHACAEEIEEKT